MKSLIISSTLALTLALAAPAFEIKVVGKPEVRQVMIPSVAYFGGDVELLVPVQVLDDNAKPVTNAIVTLHAYTKDGGVARLRAFGITDDKGMAVVRTVFDLPVLDLRASIVPCLEEPQDECGPEMKVDLTRRNDLEASFGTSRSVIAGSVPYTIVGKANSATTQDVLAAETDTEVRATFIRTLLSKGTLAHPTQLFASVEGGYSMSQLDIPLAPKNNQTSLRPGTVDIALDAAIWGRIQASAAYAPILGQRTGYWSFGGVWEQPLSDRFRLAGGYSLYSPRTDVSGEKEGSMKGPMGALVFAPKGSGNVFTLSMSYVSTGATTSRDSNQNLRLYAASTSPSATLSWDFHRGGYAYTTLFVEADQLGTPTPVYGVGMRITFRDWAHLR